MSAMNSMSKCVSADTYTCQVGGGSGVRIVRSIYASICTCMQVSTGADISSMNGDDW